MMKSLSVIGQYTYAEPEIYLIMITRFRSQEITKQLLMCRNVSTYLNKLLMVVNSNIESKFKNVDIFEDKFRICFQNTTGQEVLDDITLLQLPISCDVMKV